MVKFAILRKPVRPKQMNEDWEKRNRQREKGPTKVKLKVKVKDTFLKKIIKKAQTKVNDGCVE